MMVKTTLALFIVAASISGTMVREKLEFDLTESYIIQLKLKLKNQNSNNMKRMQSKGEKLGIFDSVSFHRFRKLTKTRKNS